MVILALVVFGAVSYRNIGVNLFPDVDIPFVTVSVVYEGADPETVETEVVDLIEEAVNTISGVKKLRSQSVEGMGQVFIEFELEEDIDVASQEVRDKVASIRADLPLEIEAPIVQKFDLDSGAILSLVLSGQDDIRNLTEYADNVVKPRLESVSGVGSIRIVGGREREVRVWLRGDVLRAYGLTAQDVTDALVDENVEPPGGRVENDRIEMIVKTKGKIERVEDFENVVVAYRDGSPLRIGDIAYVEDGLEDERSIARFNGMKSVSLMVRRQSGENLVAVAEGVKARLESVKASLPEGYELIVAQDLSLFVNDSIREAQGELFRGGGLAVFVILLFLRSFRGAFVAAITIPTTLISTYAFMLWAGCSVNMMTMLAMTISVGMVIDDTIVVLENSYRHLEEGMSRIEAARAAMAEIGFAVIATSLAVLAVFVPVAFMEGIVGRFFFEFGITVSFAVIISTFIAVTLSPMLCSRVLQKAQGHGRVYNAIEAVFSRIESFYGRALRVALRWRLAVVVLAILAFAGGMALTPFLGKTFIPESDEDQFSVQVQTPVGSSLEATNMVVSEIERRLRTLRGVTDILTTIGGGSQERVNEASIVVKLLPKSERGFSQFDVMKDARRELGDLTHIKTSVEVVQNISGSDAGFESAAIQFGLQGQDLEELDAVSKKIMQRMKEKGLVDVNSSYDVGKPQVDVVPDRNKAADLGVTVRDIGGAVQTLIGGRRAGRFEEGGETYEVRVRLVRNDRDRPESVLNVPVRSRSGELIELHHLVDVDTGTGPVQIDREGRSRKLTIYANLDQGKVLNEAVEEVKQIAAAIGLPEGTETKFSGEAENMAESFANILFSLGLAVILIYMVLAAQFESLVHPFTVMLSLPLSVVGALGLLFLTGRTINIFSMIGMIMLAGLVTKNAILLIDYTNLLRRRGVPKRDAILRAGPVRLRPILMTAMSTIAGMIPVVLGLGSGAEARAPMGTAIVGGMITSTILTLIVIPVVYSLLDDLFSVAFLNRLAFYGNLVFGYRLKSRPKRGSDVPEPATDEEPTAIPLGGPHMDVGRTSEMVEEMRHRA